MCPVPSRSTGRCSGSCRSTRTRTSRAPRSCGRPTRRTTTISGLFEVGPDAAGPVPGAVGLYHLAWEVDRVEDLVGAREVLLRAGALVGQSDHGTTKSLYAHDPDGNEFEVMWAVPRERWSEVEGSPPVAPLDLEAVVAQFSS